MVTYTFEGIFKKRKNLWQEIDRIIFMLYSSDKKACRVVRKAEKLEFIYKAPVLEISPIQSMEDNLN